MPPARNSKGLASKQARPGRGAAVENVQVDKEISQAKRSPSSPQGAPRKRSAFGDITNVRSTGHRPGAAGRPVRQCRVCQGHLRIHAGARGACWGPGERCPSSATADSVSLGRPEEGRGSGCCFLGDFLSHTLLFQKSFLLPDYMKSQPDITMDMRAILVDWMVEVQENFELTHETLYLAVKLMDHYLVQVAAMRDKLQLIGSTAILIASKFEERCPPCLDDFLYICDDAYQREELLAMERGILQTLHFDINIPIAYRFLRRFAKCARATMETLTLARFICELTLQDYAFVQEQASRLAASCLLLALRMKNLRGWSPTLEYYSGYQVPDLVPLVRRLNFLLIYSQDERLRAVRSKYSHRVFFEVAKMEPVSMQALENALQS
uniref:Uncharacterized protein n=1 Tax=Pseudonaja textilis TaxID=8673 RepID=A0A670YHM7_PSETE